MQKKREALDQQQKDRNEGIQQSEEVKRDQLRLFSSEAGRLFNTINEDSKAAAAIQLALNAGLTLAGLTKNAAQLGPVVGGLYFAAGIASAGANLAQAAKLIGVGSTPFSSSNFQVISSAGGDFAVGANGEIIPLESNSDIVTNKQGDTFDSGERSTRGLLFRLSHPYRGYADGGVVAGAVGLTAQDVIRIVQAMPPSELVLTEFRKFERGVTYKEGISTR